MNEQAQPAAAARRSTDASFHAAVGVGTVVTAALACTLLFRLAGGAFWAPLLAWLLAGAVAGSFIRRRSPAIKVAVVATVSAGLVTSLVNSQQDVGRLALKHLPRDSGPSWAQMMAATAVCSLACVLGAAAVVELQRWRDSPARRVPPTER
ncbi:MAG: hypothetical protein IT204_09750 [Fimbriimonadaceae bacterium]|nr:hypothetical protein [Fimbriimonadaceae bacterium]